MFTGVRYVTRFSTVNSYSLLIYKDNRQNLFIQLDLLVSGLETYLENCHKARQEIASAFTNEEFTKHVQVSFKSSYPRILKKKYFFTVM